MKPIGDRLLIKPVEVESQIENGITIPMGEDYLPKATVVSVSKELEGKLEDVDCPKVGDVVYYIHNARQPGRVRHEELDHFVVGIGQIAAIL